MELHKNSPEFVWNRQAEVSFWVKFVDYIDARKIAENTDGLTLSEYSQYTFAEHNSVFISVMGIKEADMEPAVKLLSTIARKSL